MSPLHVERADASSLGDLAALRYRWRTEESGELGGGPEVFAEQFRAWREEHAATHEGYVAREDGVAVGCAWLAIVARVPSPENIERRAGVLQSVYVVPERRNTGVGTALVETLIDVARRGGLDYLMVHPSLASFPFYRRLGFGDALRLLELRFDATRTF